MRPEAFPGQPLIERLEPQEIDELEQMYHQRQLGRARRAKHDRRREELAATFSALVARPAPSVERKTVSMQEAAELCGVKHDTIRSWVRLERVDYMRTVGGRPRIFVDSLFRDKDGVPVRG